MEHPGVGSLMPALRLLHQRGHQLALGYEALKSVESHRELQDLAGDCPGIEFMQLPAMGSSGWVALAAWLRRSIDYLRYLEPRYPAETRLRTRAARKAPSATRTMARGGRHPRAPAAGKPSWAGRSLGVADGGDRRGARGDRA